jgi:hypothetical protein
MVTVTITRPLLCDIVRREETGLLLPKEIRPSGRPSGPGTAGSWSNRHDAGWPVRHGVAEVGIIVEPHVVEPRFAAEAANERLTESGYQHSDPSTSLLNTNAR